MIRKILLALGIVAALAVTVTTINYFRWSSQAFEELQAASNIVDTQAGPIEYVMKGDKGPVVLFLHGTPGGYEQSTLEDPDFILLSPSRPGYLRTPLDVGRSPAEQAKAYVALLDELQIESVIVVGASGGGPSAISFAALFPERARALIAIEAVSMSTEIPEIPGFMDSDFLVWLVMSLVDLMPDKEALAIVIPNPVNQQRALETPEKIKVIRRMMWSLWPASLRGAGTKNDFEQFQTLALPVDQIRVPTLVIHGTEDINVDFSHGQLLADTVANTQFHVVEGADHMMPFTHEEEVNGVITEFIERVLHLQ